MLAETKEITDDMDDLQSRAFHLINRIDEITFEEKRPG